MPQSPDSESKNTAFCGGNGVKLKYTAQNKKSKNTEGAKRV
jgi:hypothetical protein